MVHVEQTYIKVLKLMTGLQNQIIFAQQKFKQIRSKNTSLQRKARYQTKKKDYMRIQYKVLIANRCLFVFIIM